MKVYLTYWCNNEPYEDYYESVEGVFSAYWKAVKSIEDQGYRLRKNRSAWEKKNGIQRWDKVVDEYFEVYSMWIKEMEVE